MPVVLRKHDHLEYKCPACGHHGLPVKIGTKEDRFWDWNGDTEKPTIRPSVKHIYPESHYTQHPNCPQFICHYHITNGMIEFCGDCTHDKKGQTFPLEAFSEAEVKMRELEQSV